MIYDSKAYKNVDYKRIYTLANYYLAYSEKITGFPFKTKDFVYDESDIRLCSFSKAKEKYGAYIENLSALVLLSYVRQVRRSAPWSAPYRHVCASGS